eukprot:2289937-Pyramimonas_sp.AAC.1
MVGVVGRGSCAVDPPARWPPPPRQRAPGWTSPPARPPPARDWPPPPPRAGWGRACGRGAPPS